MVEHWFLRNKVVLIILFAAISQLAVGQEDHLARMLKKFPDQKVAHLSLNKHFEIGIGKEGVELTEHMVEKTIYLADLPTASTEESVYFSSFYQLSKLKAFSLVPQGGGKYKTYKVSDFKVNTSTSNAVFYDDSKEKTFFFNHIQKGTITVQDYTYNVTQPMLMGGTTMQRFIPVENSTLSVSYPKDIEIGYRLFNIDESHISFSSTEKGGITTVKWEMKDRPDMKYESDAPNPKYYLPQIHVFIKSAKIKGEIIPFLDQPKDLHRWYRTLIKDYDQDDESDEEIKSIVDSIIQHKNSEMEKVKAIYYWVQTNINYIAFEDNLAGFIPRPPKKVCSRRFGDCKDMASIIKEMLKIAGIKGYLTWIGTRNIPYKYTELATPSVDNHMIAAYKTPEGQFYFLDATAKYFSVEQAPDHLQGKQAMVSYNDDEFEIVEIPYAAQEKNQLNDTIWVKVSKDSLIGNGHKVYQGYYRNYPTYALNILSEDKAFQYSKRVLRKGNNKFYLNTYDVSGLKTIEKPLSFIYTFSIPDIVVSYENSIYLDLNVFKSFGTKIEEDRELPFEYSYKKQHRTVVIADIPKGYVVTHVPDDFIGKRKGFDYSLIYNVTDDQIYYTLTLNREVTYMDASYFDDWNTLFEQLTEKLNESLVLEKK